MLQGTWFDTKRGTETDTRYATHDESGTIGYEINKLIKYMGDFY